MIPILYMDQNSYVISIDNNKFFLCSTLMYNKNVPFILRKSLENVDSYRLIIKTWKIYTIFITFGLMLNVQFNELASSQSHKFYFQ